MLCFVLFAMAGMRGVEMELGPEGFGSFFIWEHFAEVRKMIGGSNFLESRYRNSEALCSDNAQKVTVPPNR